MKIEDLEIIAEDFLEKEFGLGLRIPIRYNGRLKATLGRFIFYKGVFRRADSIELSRQIKDNPEVLIDVLKHELVHYAHFELGLPFNDGEPAFEMALAKSGISSSGVHRVKRARHYYTCLTCSTEFEKGRKLSSCNEVKQVINSHYCSCTGKLKYLGKFRN